MVRRNLLCAEKISTNKAIDQLFKLALTFMNLGKNEDACAAFSKLEAEFPNAPKRISSRAKDYIKRAKC